MEICRNGEKYKNDDCNIRKLVPEWWKLITNNNNVNLDFHAQHNLAGENSLNEENVVQNKEWLFHAPNSHLVLE